MASDLAALVREYLDAEDSRDLAADLRDGGPHAHTRGEPWDMAFVRASERTLAARCSLRTALASPFDPAAGWVHGELGEALLVAHHEAHAAGPPHARISWWLGADLEGRLALLRVTMVGGRPWTSRCVHWTPTRWRPLTATGDRVPLPGVPRGE